MILLHKSGLPPDSTLGFILLFYLPGIDTRIRFSLEPLPGDDAFQQWRDAMKAVARLPLGIPPEFRKKVISSFYPERYFQLLIKILGSKNK